NNGNLFPAREYPMSGPVITIDGMEEHTIEKIMDERKRGHGMQYLIHWVGYQPDHDLWM
ncbi:hypothetical protein L208DRAFT_1048023, partial [Tricholoma matsutake]